MAGEILAAASVAFTAGFIVCLLVLSRPPRRCVDCGAALPHVCVDKRACRERREALLQRS